MFLDKKEIIKLGKPKKKNKSYEVTFVGVANEIFEGSSEEEIEEYLEDNWNEITENIDWNIETEIEEDFE